MAETQTGLIANTASVLIDGSLALSGLTAISSAKFIDPASRLAVLRQASIRGALETRVEFNGIELDVTRSLTVAGNSTIFSLNPSAKSTLGSLAIVGGGGVDFFQTNEHFETVGAVSIATGSGGSSIALSSAPDGIGALTIKNGSGADALNFFDLQVNGPATISTGAGADTINMFVGTEFEKSLLLGQGNGDDTLNVQTGQTLRVIFNGKTTVKQGSGNDTLSMEQNGPDPALFQVPGNTFDGGASLNDDNGTNGDVGANGDVKFLNYDPPPANVVTASVVNGVLRLIGDDANNQISVRKDTLQDSLIVEGLNGTSIDTAGSPVATFANPSSITSINAILKGGKDEFKNSSTLATDSFDFSGGLTLHAGDGNNILNLRGAAFAPEINLGKLTYMGGDGTDDVLIGDANSAGNRLGIVSIRPGDGGTGTDGISIENSFATSFLLAAGGGDETLRLSNVSGLLGVGPPLTATGGSGNLTVEIGISSLVAVTAKTDGIVVLQVESTVNTGNLSLAGSSALLLETETGGIPNEADLTVNGSLNLKALSGIAALFSRNANSSVNVLGSATLQSSLGAGIESLGALNVGGAVKIFNHPLQCGDLRLVQECGQGKVMPPRAFCREAKVWLVGCRRIWRGRKSC